jgi:hypothetical protein
VRRRDASLVLSMTSAAECDAPAERPSRHVFGVISLAHYAVDAGFSIDILVI